VAKRLIEEKAEELPERRPFTVGRMPSSALVVLSSATLDVDN
tara:strand:- start:40 stop:165 length:126 start_codon:yes stop_codon:yes gene_type:complete